MLFADGDNTNTDGHFSDLREFPLFQPGAETVEDLDGLVDPYIAIAA